MTVLITEKKKINSYLPIPYLKSVTTITAIGILYVTLTALRVRVCVCVAGLIWREAHSLYTEGLVDYAADLWNIVDFITNVFYMVWISLRFSSWYIVQVSLSVNLITRTPFENEKRHFGYIVPLNGFPVSPCTTITNNNMYIALWPPVYGTSSFYSLSAVPHRMCLKSKYTCCAHVYFWNNGRQYLSR